MCPLDLTNRVPLSDEFVGKLSSHGFQLSDLAASLALTMSGIDLYAWDLLTTAYLGRPEMFKQETVAVEIITHGQNAGQTMLSASGRNIHVLNDVDLDEFYAYILTQWSQ